MIFPIQQVTFYVFAIALVFATLMTITVRNPVHAALFLVGAFFASSVLWMLLQAEFLALVLIFVYVGAVMTLFLFVVMMLNIDLTQLKKKFVRYLPLGIIFFALFLGMLFIAFSPSHYPLSNLSPTYYGSTYNNVGILGSQLYTHYVFPFELAGVLLLVAIIAAVGLAFFGRKGNAKAQNIDLQHQANKQTRLKIEKM